MRTVDSTAALAFNVGRLFKESLLPDMLASSDAMRRIRVEFRKTRNSKEGEKAKGKKKKKLPVVACKNGVGILSSWTSA